MKLGNLGFVIVVFLFFYCFPIPISPSQVAHRKLPKIIVCWVALVERLPQEGNVIMLKENSKIRIVRYNGRITLEQYGKSTHWSAIQLVGAS